MKGSGDILGTSLARAICKDLEGKEEPLLLLINSME